MFILLWCFDDIRIQSGAFLAPCMGSILHVANTLDGCGILLVLGEDIHGIASHQHLLECIVLFCQR